jgi:WbqC-like protein family
MHTTILQPTYLPWLGYLEMIDATQQFVVFDHVQFEPGSWQQRNQIRGPNGIILLTVPVLSDGTRNVAIAQKRIDYRQGWVRKHVRSIEGSYRKAPFFDKYIDGIRAIISSEPEKLVDLTLPLIRYIADCFEIKTVIRLSSDVVAGDEAYLDKTERVISLCRKVGATSLYDGAIAATILDADRIRTAGTEIIFQQYTHPTYPQLGGGFISHMSSIDLLFNCGSESLSILRAGSKRTLTAAV